MEAWSELLVLHQVTYTWPHGHWAENLAAIAAAWVLPGGTAFYLYGNEVGLLASDFLVTRGFESLN